MNWTDLLARQQQELEDFNALKDRAWQKIKSDHQAILTSFGDELENVPESTRLEMDKRGLDWVKNYGKDGKYLRDMLSRHNWERRAFIENHKDKIRESMWKANSKQSTKTKITGVRYDEKEKKQPKRLSEYELKNVTEAQKKFIERMKSRKHEKDLEQGD